MLTAFVCAALAIQAGGTIRPAVAIFGNDSAFKTRAYEVAVDAQSWKAIWAKSLGIETTEAYGKKAPMEVDFSKYVVLAVFQGEGWNSNGVKCVELTLAGDVLTLRYDDMSFQTAGPNGGRVPVSPFGFFVVEKGAEEFVFEENVQALKSDPAKWKEQARIRL